MSVRVVPYSRIGIFSFPADETMDFFGVMKRCPIAAEIAGSLGILPRHVLNDFFTSGL